MEKPSNNALRVRRAIFGAAICLRPDSQPRYTPIAIDTTAIGTRTHMFMKGGHEQSNARQTTPTVNTWDTLSPGVYVLDLRRFDSSVPGETRKPGAGTRLEQTFLG